MSEEAVQAAEEAPAAPEETVEEVKAPEVEAAAAPAVEAEAAPAPEAPAVEESHEDVSYQAVENEGTVTAIWEMQGRRHLRTIDPRSNEGKQILALFETAG